MSKTRVKLRSSDPDPADNLSLEDAAALVGEEGLAPLKEKAAARLADLNTLSLATLERALRRGHTGAAMYVNKTLTVRPSHHTVALPPRWKKAKTVAERAKILDELLRKGEISPAQAKTLLEVSSFSSLQRELDALKESMSRLEAGEHAAPPQSQDTSPKSPGVNRTPPKSPGVKRDTNRDLIE